MENALKALLIAAGMFFAILIISALVMFYNQISSFYEQEHELAITEQAQAFNARFENYNRNSIRGSDLISLMNKVIDYNATESYFDGTGYERIKVTIDLVSEDIIEQFKYTSEYDTNKYLMKKITNTSGIGTNWQNDRSLVAITNTSADLCNELKTLGISNATDTKLQQLSSNISNIIVDENSEQEKSYRFKRATIIKDILNADIEVDENTGKTKTESKDFVDNIKNITNKYYQYTQFKRAYFDCIKMRYDSETNRIVEMNFKVQLDSDNKVVFD